MNLVCPLLSAICFPVLCGHASIPAQPQSSFIASHPSREIQRVFESDSLLDLTLKVNLAELLKDRGEERPEHPGTITYFAADSTPVALDVKVRTRGNFRLKPGNCDFPPLRLNFKKKQVENTLFANQDKLKLVTHCRNRKPYEQYLLQEYLAYRIYNLLTDKSLRVRLARITYQDSLEKREAITAFAFLIEDEDALAQRHEAIVMEGGRIHSNLMEAEHMALLSVFQYLIGNTDWSVGALHNIVVMQPVKGDVPPFAVPYDFDYSGVVNARYAVPPPELGLRSVRERRYRGFCRSAEELAPIFARFNQRREAIYALYRNHPFLEQKQIESTLAYFDEFYETINNPQKVKWEFLESCRRE